jgi:Uma2 family endonuclease
MLEPALLTAEDLARFSPDDHRYELVEGRVIPMSPVSFDHGRIVIEFGGILRQHVRRLKLGRIVTEVGFKLASNPDTVRAPDLAFLREDRIPDPAPRGFWNGSPDLAVEVLSPDDRPADVRSKVDEYLRSGVPAVVVIDPDAQSVEIYRPSLPPTVLQGTGVVDLDDVLPGFQCTLPEIFE